MHQLTLVTDNINVHPSSVLASADKPQVDTMQPPQGRLNSGRCASSATLIASLLSHDIRHHLSVVYCNAEFLSESAIPEGDRKQLFEEVKSAITDATKMLDFILFHAKSELPAQDTVESFNDLIERTVSTIRPHPHAEGVDITVNESPSVYGLFNQTLVKSAIYNLLLNACFAAQRRGRAGNVEISLHDDHQFTCIRVKDNGTGVPAGMRQNLSKRFVTSGKHDGTGLGITIADYVAREYGGNLQLESSSPGCTIFALGLAKAVLPVLERASFPMAQKRSIHRRQPSATNIRRPEPAFQPTAFAPD